MNHKITVFTIFLAGLILSILSPVAVWSQCMTYPVSLSERSVQSTVIVEGTVVSRQSFWNNNHDFIYTGNVIEVHKVFKGSVSSSQIEIITEGGESGNTLIIAHPSLQFEIGETGIFFGIESTNIDPISSIPAALQFEGYAGNQSFVKYDIKSRVAADPHHTYPDVATDLYQAIQNETGTPFTEIIPFNTFLQSNSGISPPSPLAAPIITAISSPSTAGTFAVVTITGSNFGAGPFGGTRLVEFRDANNGGAGFIPTPANHVVSWSNTSIQVMVPTQAGSGNIRVTNDLNESTISGVTITINFNESNVVSGGTYYQPDLINDNGTGGYTFVYNTTFNANGPAVAAFERALQTWRCGTYVNFGRAGTSALSCQALDNTNLVTFDGSCALPTGVLGVSYSYYSSCGGGVWYLNENDLKFRTNGTGGINWNYGPGATGGGLFDFESVNLHELGHSHQLGHTILPVTVMNYAIGPNTDRRTLTAGSETAGGNDIMSRSVSNNSCGPSAMVALNASSCQINAPVADFTGTPTSGCNTVVVTFTDQSIGIPTSWNWSFPGGVPAAFAGQNPPPVTYGAPGSYTVTLTVSNAFGTDNEIKTNYIVVNNCPPPVADFYANPTNPCAGQQVYFVDQSTNSPTSWSWNFPGGSPATSIVQNPVVTYAAPGVYDVSLTATNPYGSGNITKTSYITVTNCPVAPVANFSGTPTSLCAGGTVNFTDLSSNNPTSWQWTFPGGTPVTSIGQNPSVTYNTAGTYSVTLTVTNGAGSNTITFNTYITVNVCAPPSIAFVGWPTTICTGSTVSFQDQSTNSPASWNWTFPGGTPAASVAQNPVITYNTAGNYNVTLQATNSFGSNSLTKTSYIQVVGCPAAGSGLIVNDGSLIHVESGALVTIQGGLINQDNTAANIGRIDNWGLITLSGDWTNNSSGNAFINSSPGTTELLGAAQTITGSTTTNFYNLTLTGSGIKTLNINTIVQGTLALNDRELATQGNWVHVTNTSPGAITRTGGLNSLPVQGFVSSTGNGRLRRSTNSSSTYLFPVGSSQGSPRFRPVALRPVDNASNTYGVRFVNNDPTLDGYPVTLKDANIGLINPYWYQKINGISGSTNPDITLFFDNVFDNIAPLPTLIIAQWAYNAPPVQWRAISGVSVSAAASTALSSATKAAWVSFVTENFDLAPESVPLPVELISFTGSCQEKSVIVKWSTAAEINNDYFLLERSYNGTEFEEIGRIEGAGTTSEIAQYSFNDELIQFGQPVYYRLTQFDFNGRANESRMIAVNCSSRNSALSNISIFPNPFNDHITVTFEQEDAATPVISVVNVLGKVVYRQRLSLDPGFHQHTISLENLAPAMYQVVIENDSSLLVRKVVKE